MKINVFKNAVNKKGVNKKAAWKYVRSAVFLLLLVFIVHAVNETFIAKYKYDDLETSTDEYKGFYEMKRDTVDVLMFGSSHAGAGFSPQDMYNAAHVRAYNLASSCQRLWDSYYWLKEALNYQTPSAVVLDCLGLGYGPASDEVANRKVLDNMRPGPVKYEAVKNDISLDSVVEESEMSYFLPFLRYHDRWRDMDEWDFTWYRGYRNRPLKGFWIWLGNAYYEGYQPLPDVMETDEAVEFPEIDRDYLDRITSLCKEHGIRLILVKTPSPFFTQQWHNAVQNYADANDLPFYDFNTESIYNAIDFDFYLDVYNVPSGSTHVNIRGGRKISRYLGEQIAANGWAVPCEDAQWEESREFCDDLYEDFEVKYTTDIEHYLEMIADDRYSVLICAGDGAASGISEPALQALSGLGLQTDWRSGGNNGYIAVIDRGRVIHEQPGWGAPADWYGCIRKGLVRVQISSGGSAAPYSSIRLDSTEYSKNGPGINFVVYNNERHCVVDSVCFDTTVPEMTCIR